MSSNLKVNSLVPATGTEIGIGTTGGTIDFRCPATFGGNVTIGGTLTYNEVINIDSIGIVTARTGLKVTGGQLDVGSNIKLGNAGVVTATTFVGALTGTLQTAAQTNITRVGGQLGIGAAPAAWQQLHITAADPRIRIQSSGTNAAKIQFADSGSGDIGVIEYSHGDNSMRFNTNSGERLRIDPNGLIGIGITNPGAVLHAYHATSNTIAQFESGDAGAAAIWKDNATYSSIEQNSTNFIIHADPGASHANSNVQIKTDGVERARFDHNGKAFIFGSGGQDNVTRLNNGNTLNIHGTSSSDGISVVRYSASYGAYGINIGKSRNNTLGTNTLVNNGNELGHVSFYGADGTNFEQAAQITGLVDGSPSDGTDMPGALSFRTTPEGSATPTERFKIDSSGNLTAVNTASGGQSVTLKIGASNASGVNDGIIRIVNGGTGNGVIQWDYEGNAARAQIYVYRSDQELRFTTAGDERLRINSTGGVGIGTVNYASDLDNRPGLAIHSNHNDSCRLLITTPTKAPTRLGYFGLNRFGVDVQNGFEIRDVAASYATRFLIASDGQTTHKTNNTSSNSGGFATFSGNSINGTVIYNEGNDTAAALQIRGNNNSGGSPGNQTYTQLTHRGADAQFEITHLGSRAMNIGSTRRIRLPGIVGVAGSGLVNVSVESDGNLCTQSSLRAHKINITTISDTSWLYNLNPVTFNWRTKTEVDGENVWGDTADNNGIQYGLIAEEVETVKKDFCYYDNNDELSGVHYDRMISPLIKAVQDQKKEIDALKAEVAALKGS